MITTGGKATDCCIPSCYLMVVAVVWCIYDQHLVHLRPALDALISAATRGMRMHDLHVSRHEAMLFLQSALPGQHVHD